MGFPGTPQRHAASWQTHHDTQSAHRSGSCGRKTRFLASLVHFAGDSAERSPQPAEERSGMLEHVCHRSRADSGALPNAGRDGKTSVHGGERYLRGAAGGTLPTQSTSFSIWQAAFTGNGCQRSSGFPKPLVFEAILAPLSHQRIFVVLSGPRSPLPPEAFLPGSFVCTPEILDLFLHYSDTFLHWVLPAELRELGMKPPSLREFLQTCRVYVHSRFLRHPGFLIPNSCIPFAVISNLKHALDYLSGGEIRPPIPQQEMRRLLAKAPPYAWNTTGAHTRNSVEKT